MQHKDIDYHFVRQKASTSSQNEMGVFIYENICNFWNFGTPSFLVLYLTYAVTNLEV